MTEFYKFCDGLSNWYQFWGPHQYGQPDWQVQYGDCYMLTGHTKTCPHNQSGENALLHNKSREEALGKGHVSRIFLRRLKIAIRSSFQTLDMRIMNLYRKKETYSPDRDNQPLMLERSCRKQFCSW